MRSYLEQYGRVQRFWGRINDLHRPQLDYEDDLCAFFKIVGI
jgi:hypothetical protein